MRYEITFRLHQPGQHAEGATDIRLALTEPDHPDDDESPMGWEVKQAGARRDLKSAPIAWWVSVVVEVDDWKMKSHAYDPLDMAQAFADDMEIYFECESCVVLGFREHVPLPKHDPADGEPLPITLHSGQPLEIKPHVAPAARVDRGES